MAVGTDSYKMTMENKNDCCIYRYFDWYNDTYI